MNQSEWIDGIRRMFSNSDRWLDSTLVQTFCDACGVDDRGVARSVMGFKQFEYHIRAANGTRKRRVGSTTASSATWMPTTCTPYRFERDPLTHNIV